MSHVATVDIEIRDLPALAAACKRLGLEFVQDLKTCIGVGDCDHVIRLPNQPEAYEIGLRKRTDSKPGWTLAWEAYAGSILTVAGKNCSTLKQAYAAVIATRTAQQRGFQVQEHVQSDGSIRMVLTK
jgi:hypothetical protein